MVKTQLESGDIFAIKSKGIIGWLACKVFNPETDRFHFGIVWLKVKDDWIILESINKGIAVGRLSFYKGQDIKFYRVNCSYGLRRKAGATLTKYGRSKYDYRLIVKIAVGCLLAFFKILFTEFKFRKLKAEDLLSWRSDNSLICTEAAELPYRKLPLTNPNAPPLPSAFKQAKIEGRISEIKGE